jgi:S-adenosylmethionine hydrolase
VTPKHCVTLLTDYGLEDGFVAACHGVIASICPPARIIDITHLVPPGDVRRGAAVMAQTVPYLPAGVHVAVIDPGVGTRRRAIAVAVGDRVFVGPDNGVLSWAATDEEIRAFELTDQGLWLDPVSATFHGRDIFSPVAAHIAAGRDVATVGEEIDPAGLVRLPPPARNVRDGTA